MKANPKHLNFLLKCTEDWLSGYFRWNEWRDANPEVVPQLADVDFTLHYKNYDTKSNGGYFRFALFNFKHANFQNSNLSYIEFASANLKGANFKNANLESANLVGAKLKNAHFLNARLRHVPFKASAGKFVHDGADFGGGNPEHIIRVARMDKWDNVAWEKFRAEEEEINLQGAYLTHSG